MFWIGSKSSGGPLFSSFGNLGVVGDLLGGSVVTDGHGNFNCFRGPDVMKKKFPSKPDTANEVAAASEYIARASTDTVTQAFSVSKVVNP